ncbi:MAG: lipopolysaccharide transport periplasmic protein LptA [Pseudomonadota bacterium]
MPLIGWTLLTAAHCEAPVTVQSDRAELFFEQQVMHYSGHVLLVQGDRQIHCERLSLQADHGSHVSSFQADGAPATFSGDIEQGNPTVFGHANTLVYAPQEGLLTLTGQAVFQQGQDSFSGERLVYDIQRGTVRAVRGTDKKAQLIIQPH